jgi:UDP-2,3-diacylglucosamine pyrophosphatase LpxH
VRGGASLFYFWLTQHTEHQRRWVDNLCGGHLHRNNMELISDSTK